MERFRRLITRDGIKSELQPHHDFRPSVSTVLKAKNAGMLAENTLEEALEAGTLEHEEREYRYRRTLTIKIYEYEEK